MSPGLEDGLRSASPASSGRASPAPRTARRAAEDAVYKTNKGMKRYAATIERCLASWETSPEEWADYIAFLSRLLKAIQSRPGDCPFLPHSAAIASDLAQCLNPSLPSGVHQKAVEVYGYIFAAFPQDYISAHLLDFLPVISSVLAFASLSVRPAVYDIYEEYLLHFPTHAIRPALKSLILSLLPAVEEDTSEDFERAYAILAALQTKFTNAPPSTDDTADHSGYFWQCLFLAIITSPSRRQGALNYLVRTLPRFATSKARELSIDAEAVIVPEPGLLVRAFVAGLSDVQPLVQRGFLDLLVTHLPLHAVIFENKIQTSDLDRLVNASIHVLLRRDMGLNRRVWSWFLGPEEGGEALLDSRDQPSHAALQDNDDHDSVQLKYFLRYGRASLERCVLDLFSKQVLGAANIARPFRICLSLMDRWEIGGAIIPRIFLPAIETAREAARRALASDSADFIRSASLFFDGVEARLIWSNLARLLHADITGSSANTNGIELVIWTCRHFNVKDEDMIETHIPFVALYSLALLNARTQQVMPDAVWESGLECVSTLVELLPVRASNDDDRKTGTNGVQSNSFNEEHIQRMVETFYLETNSAQTVDEQALASFDTVLSLLLDQTMQLLIASLEGRLSSRFVLVTAILTSLLRCTSKPMIRAERLFEAISSTLDQGDSGAQTLPFPMLNSLVSLFVVLHKAAIISSEQVESVASLFMPRFWNHLSPTSPQYHVEAVRCIWDMDDILSSHYTIKVEVLKLVRGSQRFSLPPPSSHAERLRQFAVLWSHTISAYSTTGRRNQRHGESTDIAKTQRRSEILYDAILLVLDSLHDEFDPVFAVIRAWIQSLSSLPALLAMLIQHLVRLRDSVDGATVDSEILQRARAERRRELGYLLSHVDRLIVHASGWAWHSLCRLTVPIAGAEKQPAITILTKTSCEMILTGQTPDQCHHFAVRLLGSLLIVPSTDDLDLDFLESTLLDKLIDAVKDQESEMAQGQLLQLVDRALKIRLTKSAAEALSDSTSRISSSFKRPPSVSEGSNATPSPALIPTARLLTCLQVGFAAASSRPLMDQWLGFLAKVLPTIAGVLLPNLIPLVDCFCTGLEKAFSELKLVASSEPISDTYSPDAVIIDLLEGLEMTLAKAHDSLLVQMGQEQQQPQQPSKSSGTPSNFFGAMTSTVFKVESLSQSKSASSNSRFTVVLAFHDAIRLALKIWAWAGHNIEQREVTTPNAATINFSAFRVRNKARQVMEHIFAVEPLESLEVVIAYWRNSISADDAKNALGLLHSMQGVWPKNILPSILDALCSRTNPSVVPAHQLSSQAVQLAAIDIAVFLVAYMKSTEDDAMDELWNDCVAFLRDVLANPLPYRQVLPAMLTFVLLLADKLNNTNHSEQRKMKREVVEVFQRLMAATFTTMSISELQNSRVLEANDASTLSHNDDTSKAPSLLTALAFVVDKIDTIIETNDRVVAVMNNITTNVISPTIHAKSFPTNIHHEVLTLLLGVSQAAPNAKLWKKEVSDAFFDPRFFSMPVDLVEDGWFPILNQWTLRDKERMPDLLSRLTPPSTAGIMFGVGASAARLEADRKSQLNLRRVCILLLASESDTYVTLINDLQAKLVNLFEATLASSPSAAIKPELFLLCRSVMLAMGINHVAPLWPIINMSLQSALSCLVTTEASTPAFNNLALLQACKLLDLLITLSPDDFQLHEWLYITDTIDAVYHPPEWTPSALADSVAETLGDIRGDESQGLVSSVQSIAAMAGRRKPLLNDVPMDQEDLKALSRDECARLVLRPFLSQLSILAYEGVYSMEAADVEACRRNLLNDLLDARTMIE